MGLIGGNMPINMRNTIGHVPGHTRTASPVGLAPNSPMGSVGYNAFTSLGAQHSVGDGMGTSRGRSPPPSMSGAPGAGPPSVRGQRAITPSSLVKGITTGIQAGGTVQRNSLGAPPLLLQR